MFVMDNDAVYVDVNDAACRAVSLSREDFVGRRLGFGTERERLGDVARMWTALRRTGHLVIPYQYDTPDGATMRLDIVCTADTPTRDRHLAMYWRQAAPPAGERLSPRQLEVTRLLALGLTGEQIARRLFLSPDTVRTHIRNAMRSMRAQTRAQLVARAVDRGLISLDAPG